VLIPLAFKGDNTTKKKNLYKGKGKFLKQQ
jgi:hypothetical protein